MSGIILLQTAGAQFGGVTLAAVLLAFIAGLAVPTGYGLERLAGFGRWFAGKLPYQPPPGASSEAALAEAVDTAEGATSAGGGGDGDGDDQADGPGGRG